MTKKKLTFNGLWGVLKRSYQGYTENKVPKLSAALAYYTVFSMGPLLLVIISLGSIFFGKEAIEGRVFGELKSFLGTETAAQIQDIIKKGAVGGKGPIAAAIGIGSLLLGATTIFGEIQDSINMIWGLKAKPEKGLLKLVINRLMSFSVIGSLGFLLLVSLIITTLIDGFSNRLQVFFPQVTVFIFYIVNQVITVTIVVLIFAVIFKVLPDARIKWRDVTRGAIVTAILFMIGKFGISLYISKSNVGSTYGAAGSLVILLLWTYYSALILYYGAEFTKAYALEYGSEILPNGYAVTTKDISLETGGASVKENEKIAAQAEKVIAQ